MSSFNLKEFNNLSRSHNYFMTNDRLQGFPTLQENSLILRNILENRDSNSTDKIYNFKTVKPKKYVKFKIPESPGYNSVSKVQLIYHQLYPHNNAISTEVPFNYHRYHRKNNIRNISYNIDNQNIINPYENNYIIKVNKNLNMPKYYKISSRHMRNIITSPEISNYAFSNSNINDSDNEIHTLSFKGSKFFANSFFGLNNDSIVVSPEKNNISNSNSNITKGIELFRNYDELKKKKEEIIQRKMKKNLSPKIEENLMKERNKDLKEKTINIKLQQFEPKIENKSKLIPLLKDKDGIFNMKKIKPRFNSNDTNPNSKQKNANNNSYRIIINQPLKNNPNKINITINNKVNNSNNTTFSNEINQSNIIKVSNSTTDLKNNNNIIYNKKKYKTNNIFISKYCSPQKMTVNNKIKENSETIRKKYENSEKQHKVQRPYNIKTYSPYLPDILASPNRFIILSKKFVEDYSSRTPTFLYSDDKKISIKVHIIPNLEETFFGRKKTKEKMKMQRVISIYFINENDSNKGLNLIRNKIKKNTKELNNNALSAIKEEEEKSRVEPEILGKKDDSQNKIKISSKLEYPEHEPENVSKIEKKEEKIETNKNKNKNEEKNNKIININEISNKNENEIKEKLSPTNNDYELMNNKIKENNKKEEKKLDNGVELLKTEPKVEKKRFFRRRFDKSNKNPEVKSEIKEKEEKKEEKEKEKEKGKEKEKEQDKNQSQIKQRSYRRIFERNKNALKQDELNNNTEQKIEITESFNNKRKYETLNKQSEPELLTTNSKKDIKRDHLLTDNFNKKEEKYIDEYGKKLTKTESIKVIEQKPNFRANFRRRFDKSKNETISMTDAGKNETKTEPKEIDKNFRRRFDKQKIESESQTIKNENKNDIKEKDNKNLDNKIRRRFQHSNPGNNIESIKKEEKIEKNEIQPKEKKYRRRFQKDEPKPKAEIKIEINDEPKGKKRRFENQIHLETNSPLIKDEKKAGVNEKLKTENNIRKRYVRHFGNKK